ncbi:MULTISPECIES: pilus assembly protein [unclassified Agarivorans]|uniref:pilus assembly protein n=1 Tax=unclassified Agarivorans TaxID=2636026 RepID=UPI0026E3525A|nr:MULTISPECIES: PilC/PilY family type IV pilus protein [unclassified Agarivorans]MDO6685077.1 PilC/PilY family type IV pilus protein [Agarivorans sp. 3_MG-2023]MDO6715751.1 PilC/PilY family type IV pilus protein [Agarivorans sp. 2_MG-2023]
MNGHLKSGLLACLCTISVTCPVWADDTELFLFDFNSLSSADPKVLIIFDTSGSMAWNITTRQGYNRDNSGDLSYQDYPVAVSSQNSLDNDFIYFTVNGVDGSYIPTGANDDRRFIWDINNCAASYEALAKNGVFTGYFREHRVQGGTGSWDNVRLNNGANYTVLDCMDDYELVSDASDGRLLDESGDPRAFTVKLQESDGSFVDKVVSTINPGQYRESNNSYVDAPQGYPINGASNNTEDFYTLNKTDAEQTTKDSFDDGYLITLYSANYLRWYHHSDATTTRPRIEIAQEALANALDTINGVSFGLMVFNTSNHGGRVIRRIQAADNNDALITDVVELDADGGTPLVETLMEAKRYFAGETVVYGLEGPNGANNRDTSIESSGSYITPYEVGCDSSISIIYITDGTPSVDAEENDNIGSLPINTNGVAGCDGATTVSACTWSSPVKYGEEPDAGETDNRASSYLPVLAKWMNTNDINGDVDGRQYAKISTIGFGEDVIEGGSAMLIATAENAEGRFYPAEGGVELESALRQALIGIYEENSSLVSPAVTSNNFDRTRTLDRVYYAMFKPSLTPRWRGNLKKLELSAEGYMVDQNGNPAIGADGSIIDEAKTFWSSVKDGNNVELGGVADSLASNDARMVYFNQSNSGNFANLNSTNLVSRASTSANLANHLGVVETDLSDHINWIRGSDIDNDDGDSLTTIRSDLMGDPLHSRPLVINYGLRSGASASSTDPDDMDIRILVGTNGGAMHMFKDSGSSVAESWAFFPYELLGRQLTLRNNIASSQHVYGVDGTPTVFLKDTDNDGKYSTSGDKVLVFTGLRRGGDAYYAMDLTNSDLPKMLWKIDSSSTGMSELGQSWSQPTVGYVPGHTNPVVIFGAGYDVNQDLSNPAIDDKGRGVFIVDALDGSLVWSLTNSEDDRLTHSVPAKVASLDSDGDGNIDRLYFGDMGGQLWRIDLHSTDEDNWKMTALAKISDDSVLTDKRKFFTEPVIVRTYLKKLTRVTTGQGSDQVTITDSQQIPYDAVLIGTGDRTKPVSDKDPNGVNNRFYMFRDYNVQSTNFTALDDNEQPIAITSSDLYNITSDPIGSLTDETAIETQLIALGASKGWVHNLVEDGEKSLGAALVLGGDLYFTSFIPETTNSTTCTIPTIGTGRTYGVSMHIGTSINHSRYYDVDNKVPDDLIIHSGEDESGESVIRVFGGDPGEDLQFDDEDEDQQHTCEQTGSCREGSREANMDMSPKQIYFYFDEG